DGLDVLFDGEAGVVFGNAARMSINATRPELTIYPKITPTVASGPKRGVRNHRVRVKTVIASPPKRYKKAVLKRRSLVKLIKQRSELCGEVNFELLPISSLVGHGCILAFRPGCILFGIG